jgi:hypothetical protein
VEINLICKGLFNYQKQKNKTNPFKDMSSTAVEGMENGILS